MSPRSSCVVLLIGLMVVSVGIVGATVLGTDYFDPEPQANLVYDEDATGNVGIAVEDARHMSADKTEIRLQGAGHCTDWEGSGDVEKGDVTITGFNDCPDQLEQGDVIQVIGNGRLVDTYELQGVYPDYGCKEFEDEIEDNSKITIDSGETVACDFGAPGDRIDSEIEIKDGGRLIGDIFSDAQLKTDSGSFVGTFDSDLVGTSFDIVDADIDGSLVSSDKITIKDGGSVITGDIDSDDEVDILPDNSLYGSISADGKVWVRENTYVGGDVTAQLHEVEVDDGATIEGQVDAASITCDGDAKINGDDCEEYDG